MGTSLCGSSCRFGSTRKVDTDDEDKLEEEEEEESDYVLESGEDE
jgi:hypothetical protein